MTPQEFKNIWIDADNPLSPISPARLARFSLSNSTLVFLTIAGLPGFAGPNLSFVNDTDDIIYGINKLTEQYDLFDRKADFEKYIVIGSCRDGDPIAINTDKDDQVEELDHEDFFSSKFFNASINSLGAFLILFRDFERSVLMDKDPNDRSQLFNFTNIQFENLKTAMRSVDVRAVTEDGFWKDELEIILSIRKEYFDKT